MNKTKGDNDIQTTKNGLKRFKNEIGITLIALVITIIVLLILAAVSIAMLTGENGILTQANRAKSVTKEAEIDERKKLAQAEANLNMEDTEYTAEDGTVKIPAGMAPTKIEGENAIKDGLVAVDKKGNSWVWIEVPKTATVYPTAGINITASAGGEFTNDEYTKIYNDLKTYTADYKDSWKDIWYSGCGIADGTEYNKLKNKMLKSIYQTGGFWIGQYEMGTYTARKSKDDELTTPVCKEGAYPYNYITCAQAQERASLLSTGNYTSSLMFGVQWDLVLKFIETRATNPGTSASNIKEALKTNSTDWGNYADATFEIQRGEYSADWGDTWKSFDVDTEKNVVNKIKQKVDEDWENGVILLTTGATERNSLVNIYDLAGNVFEWTLEKSSDSIGPCVRRGGRYYSSGSNSPASFRSNDQTSYAYGNIGTRLALY